MQEDIERDTGRRGEGEICRRKERERYREERERYRETNRYAGGKGRATEGRWTVSLGKRGA